MQQQVRGGLSHADTQTGRCAALYSTLERLQDDVEVRRCLPSLHATSTLDVYLDRVSNCVDTVLSLRSQDIAQV